MSRALSSARQRRAGVTQPEPQLSQVQKPSEKQGLTLPQVIALIDNRLIKLETFVRNKESEPVKFSNLEPIIENEDNEESSFGQIIDDFNQRFIMLAEEIGSIKDTLLKLQTYTMDVNKMLLEERVNVLSDLGNNDKSLFVMQNDTTILDSEIENIQEQPIYDIQEQQEQQQE